MTKKNVQSPTMKPKIEQNNMDLTSETVMANEQMDREFNGEEQEAIPSEMNAAWIIRN
ncbi:hypothetical protein SAMN04487897_10160 [Paenibacillus sp. yr247]|uniref:hypothetical protein n=1 Tax=Paenibacillus sp. yr247 TaxID=1761880 RepID=UPI0008833ED4|nr:hypothetical protein [Paenibacillus sp. yr247]SDM79248.1 hypothetical protein SAMN04487897_10160 [Paenibacillus sp. yr247]